MEGLVVSLTCSEWVPVLVSPDGVADAEVVAQFVVVGDSDGDAIE